MPRWEGFPNRATSCGSVVSPFFTSDSLRESKLLPTEAQPQRKAVAIRMQSVSHTLGSPKPAKIRHWEPAWQTADFSLPKARTKPRRQSRRLAVKKTCCLGTRGVQPANRRRNLTSLKAVWDRPQMDRGV
jgi:hypothetical protein